MGPPPVVTGISPKEGPPGTRVTIRGEHLGTKPQDLTGLTICGCDCLLSAEWKSSNKIVARSGPGKARGDIIITTVSGGKGTSTVQFRGYHETIGPLKESAVWVEEAPLQTLAWGRRSLSPTSYQMEDPLGLSVEGNEKKFPEDDLHELFPEGSGDLASDQFEPGWFLLEHHHATSFDDLRVGLAFLRRKVEGQKEGQLSFLKANVGSVMEQLDTLNLLKEKFEADVKIHGIDPTVKVEHSIRESMLEAHKLFEGVLARRERADATRNALGVLQRFRFLFTLPVAIERNIKRGEYDAVINDYARAHNLFGKTDVAVFRKVLVEVEQKINDLREMLRLRLQDMPVSLDQQKKIIRNLVNLEANGDPAWDAVIVQSNYLTQRLKSCQEAHISADNAMEEQGKTPKSSSHSAPKHTRTPSGNQVLDMQGTVPQRVLCVEVLTEIISSHFPDLWKLGQAYFSGELQVPVGSGRQQEFKNIVLNMIGLFCSLLRAAVLPHTSETKSQWPSHTVDQLHAWLSHCLRYVRSSYISLIALDLPGEALDIVGKLLFDLQLHCMSTSLWQASEQVALLHSKETWQLQFDPNHGGITNLPNMFEEIFSEAVTLVKEIVLQSGIRESQLLENDNAKKELSSKVQNLLISFVQTLEKLINNDDGDHSSAVSQLIGSPAHFRDHSRHSGLVWEQRLLSTLSNCDYTKREILPRLTELLNRHGYPPLQDAFSAVTTALSGLEKRIIETYIEHKSDPLVGTIEPSMYLGRFDWDTQHIPTDLRPYAKEIIVNIIAVHAEVYCISPKHVHGILSQIVETVAEELSRLMSCVTKFSTNGNKQARIDVTALKQTFSNYTTSTAESFFTEAVEAIPPLKPGETKVVDDVLKVFHSSMRLQLACFKVKNT
ncbi:exocyst complex component secretory 5 isoform X2 [Lycorma delicatula]|uniref:exocyst complex component secretory 5 isoform X2 n=1 Tax=Lycorma delicatula TaxID=130591 RepID=UPI003F514E6C